MRRKGRCSNFRLCEVADEKSVIEVDYADDFICPSCQNTLTEVSPKSNKGKIILFVLLGLVIIALGFGGAWWLTNKKNNPTQELLSPIVEDAVENTTDPSIHTDALGVPITKLYFERKNRQISEGEQLLLKLIVSPEDATLQQMDWSTDDPEIATVDQYGRVTGNKPGLATIFAVSENMKHRVMCLVEVTKEAKTKGIDESEEQGSMITSRTLRLPYGIYIGDVLNNKMHGNGKLTFSQRHVISENDLEDPKREAMADDYIEGTFYKGEFVMGDWYSTIKKQSSFVAIGR